MIDEKLLSDRLMDGGGKIYDTFTYVSGTQMKLTTGIDWSAIIKKGTKVELNDGAVKYGYVVATSYSAPDFTVTLSPLNNAAGTVSTLANHAITDVYMGNLAMLRAHPILLNYTTTWAGGTPAIGDGTLKAKFFLEGPICWLWIHLKGGNTTNWGSSAWTFTLPIACAGSTGEQWIGAAKGLDSGTTSHTGVAQATGAGSTVSAIVSDGNANNWSNSNPFTWAVNDVLSLSLHYPI